MNAAAQLREHRLRRRIVGRDVRAEQSTVVAWLWRASIVPVIAMPMLPPMLRIRLNRLVALPIRSRGIASIETVVSGTKSSDMPTPWSSCGQKMSQ